MSEHFAYDFEELSDELARPPMAALRALLQSGLVVSPKGWQALPLDVRFSLAREGMQGVVDTGAVRRLAEKIQPRHIKLVSRSADPNPDQVPPQVSRALGPTRPISDAEWRALRAVDRSVIASLAGNSRLLARAYDELAVLMGRPATDPSCRWFGALAHCDVAISVAAVQELLSPRFLDGRGLLLARVAGIRAARRAAETFDLQADAGTGPVELDWCVAPSQDSIVWQAHVSTWEGAFFPAASLLAVTTAAAAVFDMAREIDPTAHVANASIREEAWTVGSAASRLEETTSVYTASALFGEDGAPAGGSASPSPDATIRMAPEEIEGMRQREAEERAEALATAAASPANSVSQQMTPAPVVDSVVKGSPRSSRAEAAPMRASAPEPFVPRPVEVDAPYRTSGGIPRVAVWLFAGALVVFGMSVGILAYVLVQL